MILFLETLLSNWHLITFFFIIAILYSSVGFGGGSSYLAILALTSIAYVQIRAIALLCNIIVVLSNIIYHNKNNYLIWKKITPLTLFSVPFAFIGGFLKIDELFFFILLGITLFVAAVTMWVSKDFYSTQKSNSYNHKRNIIYGSGIGFISGMVGIGGGIFLAPILHLTNWDSPKKIAATASFFILVNSISGLIGQTINSNININWNLTIILIITVFIGAQVGRKINHNIFTPSQLKKATAILIAFVSIRILLKHLL